jgi:hypothetical protein
VRVGRAPLDEDAIRLIEQSNPGIEFDWTSILKGQDAPAEVRPPVQHERRARPRPRPDIRPPAPVPVPRDVAPVLEQETVPEMHPIAEVSGPVALVEEMTELEVQGPVSPITAPTPASVRLGSEGLARLRARHAEVLARIAEKIADPARRDQLKADAERLNPDTWVTDAEVVAGLERYEVVFESLRGVIGRRRKRRRRRAGGAERDAGGAENTSAPAPDGEPEEDTGPDETPDDL